MQVLAGTLRGYQLRFNKRATGKPGVAYANIAYCRDECIEGLLYRLEHSQDIALMDPFEGNPVRYSREVFTLETEQGPVSAWVYVANAALIESGLLPERRYLNHLLAGRSYHSDAYHHWLASHATVDGQVEADDNSGLDSLVHNV